VETEGRGRTFFTGNYLEERNVGGCGEWSEGLRGVGAPISPFQAKKKLDFLDQPASRLSGEMQFD
jgi:hypothetical protein